MVVTVRNESPLEANLLLCGPLMKPDPEMVVKLFPGAEKKVKYFGRASVAFTDSSDTWPIPERGFEKVKLNGDTWVITTKYYTDAKHTQIHYNPKDQRIVDSRSSSRSYAAI